MAKLSMFNFITLDGYYKGINEDISWHKHGAEEGEFSAENVKTGNTLLFGRVTYDMMSSFWPTPMAQELFPEVAEGMNKAPKIVCSNTLKSATWNNTRIINGDIVEVVRKLKQSETKDITILGSGSIVTLLAQNNLIDEYQIMIDPVAIGAGTPIFNGITHKLDLELIRTRTFKSGTTLLVYKNAER